MSNHLFFKKKKQNICNVTLKKKHKNLLIRFCKTHAMNMKRIIGADCRPCTALSLFPSQSPAALALEDITFWNLLESGCLTKIGSLNKVFSGAAFLCLRCVEIFKEGRKMRRFPNHLTAETAPARMPMEWDSCPTAQTWERCFCTVSLLFLYEVRRLR